MDPVKVAIVVVAILVLVVIFGSQVGSFLRQMKYGVGFTEAIRASDGSLYRVHKMHGNPQTAAELMAYLHDWSIDLIEHLRNKYLRSPQGARFPARRKIVQLILDRYDPDALAEGSPLNPSGDTSYVLNKGEEFVMCLREKDPARTGDPDKHDFHDRLILTFVKTHELAHLGVNVRQHPPEFWECFKFLLQESDFMAPGGEGWPDYERFPTTYCGMEVNYNPLLDPLTVVPT